MNKRPILPFILFGIIVFAMVFRWQPIEPSPGIVLDRWTGQTWYIEPIYGKPEFKVSQIDGHSSFATKVSGSPDQELATANEKSASYIDQFRKTMPTTDKEQEELKKFNKASFLRDFLTTSSVIVLVLTILWMIFEVIFTAKRKKDNKITPESPV